MHHIRWLTPPNFFSLMPTNICCGVGGQTVLLSEIPINTLPDLWQHHLANPASLELLMRKTLQTGQLNFFANSYLFWSTILISLHSFLKLFTIHAHLEETFLQKKLPPKKYICRCTDWKILLQDPWIYCVSIPEGKQITSNFLWVIYKKPWGCQWSWKLAVEYIAA